MSQLRAKPSNGYSTHSERNLNLYEGWKAPADLSLCGLCPHHSHPSSIPLFYPWEASCIYNLPRMFPQGVEMAIPSACNDLPPDIHMAPCLTSCKPLLPCQLISEDISSILHKIAPFLSTIVILSPLFIFPKLLSPSDIYSFYLFFSVFLDRK